MNRELHYRLAVNLAVYSTLLRRLGVRNVVMFPVLPADITQ